MPDAVPKDVPETVLALVAAIKRIPRDKVTLDSTFEELGIDSLDGMNLLFEVEAAFDISIPDQQARSIRSVRQMVEGVNTLLAAAERS